MNRSRVKIEFVCICRLVDSAFCMLSNSYKLSTVLIHRCMKQRKSPS
jgi:hypothetical protein